MKFKLLLLSLLVLTLFSVAGCTRTPVDTSTEETTQESVNEDEEAMLEEMPAELTADEAATYKAELPLQERVELANDLATLMPMNGMVQMATMFPDLRKMTSYENDHDYNMMKAGTEDWLYSEEGDFTVVVCAMANSPIHLFEGADPSAEDVELAIEMMEEMMNEDSVAGGVPQYLEYSQGLYESLLGEQPFALFFHAAWCPTCRWMESEINQNLENYPKNTVILKVDYDTEDALKQKYGILSQSTVVVLDAEGKVTDTLIAPDSDQIEEAVQNSLNA